MIKKQSIDDENMLTSNSNTNLSSRLQKIQSRCQKMYDNIDEVISKTANAIKQCEKEVMVDQNSWNNCLSSLHSKMTEIKPLKTVRGQYNDFYKKLSGLGKIIQQIPAEVQEPKIKVPNPFNAEHIRQIESQLSDHYLSQRNYQIAQTIRPQNEKRKLFEECFMLRNDILQGNFDRPAEWIENNLSSVLNQSKIGYEIHKMKIINLVKESKADEAIAYLRKNLSQYANQNGNEISKLMNFIITHSSKFWGSEADYSSIFKNRYDSFVQVSLKQLAEKFTKLYLNKYKIYLVHPVYQCHEVGVKYRQQFIVHLKFMPETMETINHLPFSIKTGNQQKYHSYFFCPISKQVFGCLDKNVVLNCGHMVSHQAVSKITEGKDIRRKMKCPICQSEQIIENSMKVQF